MPPLPWELKERFISEFKLSEYDAQLLTEEKETAMFFLELTKHAKSPKACANVIINKIKPWAAEQKTSIKAFPIAAPNLAALLQLIEEGKVSNTVAYQKLFPALLKTPDKSPLELAESLNLIQSSDSNFLEQLVEEVIAANPDKVKAYQKGKKGLIGFFMGEVMKKSKGKAEPKATNALLREKLK